MPPLHQLTRLPIFGRPIGAAVGPALGGFIAQGYGLQAPFYFVASAIALVAVNNYMRLPETHPRHEKLKAAKVSSIAQDIGNAFSQWRELLQSRGMHVTSSTATRQDMLTGSM
jgi:MFS family permease